MSTDPPHTHASMPTRLVRAFLLPSIRTELSHTDGHGVTVLGRLVVAVSIVSAVAAVLAGFGTRAGWWHFRTGFQILTWAAYGGLGTAVLECAAFLLAWRKRQRQTAILAAIEIGRASCRERVEISGVGV